jgi:hypothetical protein
LGKEEKAHTLLEAIKDHNQKMKALIDKEYVKGTLDRFEVLKNHVTSFLQAKYPVANISIRKVDHAVISDFEFYLKTEKNCAHNTAIKYLKNLGKVVRICMSIKWIDKDPFFGYKLKSKPVERPFHSEDELQLVAEKKFSTNRLLQVRD